MGSTRILAVDDSPDTLEIVRRHLEKAGYSVSTAASVSEAVDSLSGGAFELVITDLKMPGHSGLDLVRWVRENLPEVEVMMITGYASLEGAVEAVKSGAEEYLAKPFTEEELLSAVRRALDARRRRLAASAGTEAPESLPGLVGSSSPMQALYRDILKAAQSDATVLVLGESGTGKELVARAIHYRSRRAAARFVPINCGAIPDSLMESELFGHVRGAFTGATAARAGFFQTADRGTVFLDEVGELSLAGQVRLLRVLQDGEVCMVGSNQPRRVDVRVVAATNKNLPRLVEQGRFREDLYYRLNVVTLEVPPLRARGEDVLLLAAHFARRFAEETGRPAPRFSEQVLQRFLSYDWPGNVRELENACERLVILAKGDTLSEADLPRQVGHRGEAGPSPEKEEPVEASLEEWPSLPEEWPSLPPDGLSLIELERTVIERVLELKQWNISQAARYLRIPRHILTYRMEKYGLRRPQ